MQISVTSVIGAALQTLEAFLFCPQYPYLVLPGKMKNNACRMRDTSASLNLPLPLCVPHSHTLSNHAFAQSEESQLPAPVAHHRLRGAAIVQQHRGQSSGVCLQEEQDALQLSPLPPYQPSHSACDTPARPTL